MRSLTCLAAMLATAILLAACSETAGDSTGSGNGLQLVREGEPTGTVTIRNIADYTVGVVTFLDCQDQQNNVSPQRQVIEPGDSVSFEVSAGCYDLVAGEAGLSFNHLVDRRITVVPGEEIVLP